LTPLGNSPGCLCAYKIWDGVGAGIYRWSLTYNSLTWGFYLQWCKSNKHSAKAYSKF
jgi:hypothetical protein